MAAVAMRLAGVMEIFWVPPEDAARLRNIQDEIDALKRARQARADALLAEGGADAIVEDAELDAMAADIAELEAASLAVHEELKGTYAGMKKADVERIIDMKGMLA